MWQITQDREALQAAVETLREERDAGRASLARAELRASQAEAARSADQKRAADVHGGPSLVFFLNVPIILFMNHQRHLLSTHRCGGGGGGGGGSGGGGGAGGGGVCQAE